MVKAIKRKTGQVRFKEKTAEKAKSRDDKDPFFKRHSKVIILTILVLITTGFVLQLPFMMSSRGSDKPTSSDDGTTTQRYGVGTSSGTRSGNVISVSNYSAVFGQLDSILVVTKKLDGDLYLLDDGATQLILTKAKKSYVESTANGEFIIYDIASCGDFDCLVNEMPNGSVTFAVYELNASSSFLKTTSLGLPVDISTPADALIEI